MAKDNTYFCCQTIPHLKQFLTIFILFFYTTIVAQTDSSLKAETTAVTTQKPVIATVKKPSPIADSLRKIRIDSTKKVDSLIIADSVAKFQLVVDSLRNDSITKAIAKVKLPKIDTSTYLAILSIPYLPFGGQPKFMIENEYRHRGKEELFYILLSVITVLALIKIIYPKYFSNMFGLFFQTTLRSKQTRDQLLQNALASLLMNFLFIACGGIYIALVVQMKGWVSVDFWWLILYSAIILLIIYAIKFGFLHFIGWVFNTKEATNTYIFIVFLSNKIIAVALLPFVVILAFTGGQIAEVAFIVSLFLIIAMLLYRYLVSLGSVRADLSINPLHFFLYLCTVEILPLLLIYKAAFNYIGTSI